MNNAARSLLLVGMLTAAPLAVPASSPITIGALLPLTGPGSVTGNLERDGIQFAVDQANAKGGIDGHVVQLLVLDHQAKPAQAVMDYRQLVDLDHTPAILSSYSGPTLAIAPLATRQKVLLINAGAQADNLAHASPYLINTTPMIADEVDVLTRYMMAHNLRTAAILYENDSADLSGRDDFVAAYAKAGGRIVGQEPIDFGQTDFRPDLLRLAASKPDAVFVNLTVATQPLADQYHQLGLPFVVVGTSFFADPTLIADPAANGWIHTQVKIDASPDLAAGFQDKYHAPMDFHVRQWYNGATVLLTAIQRVVSDNQPVTGENLLKAIFVIRRFQGLIPMEFDTNTASVPISINKFQDGKDVEIEKSTSQ